MSNYSLASVRERQADAANPDNVVAEPDYSEQAVVNDAEPVSPEEAREIEQERFYDREGKYITSLTADQKNRLMLVLLNTQTIEDKDFPLIQVAKDWDDPRYVPFLLTQLRAITDASSYQVTILMTIVADKLDDASLKDLATEYRDNLYSNEMESNDESEAVESGSAEQTNTDEQRVVPASPAELKRQAKLQYFIALAESVVPKADADNALNASASEKP
jgi:hypothetical protein